MRTLPAAVVAIAAMVVAVAVAVAVTITVTGAERSPLAFTPSPTRQLSADGLRAAVDVGGDPVQLRLEILSEVPVDPGAFTQGLEFDDDGSLLMSTGLYGSSTLRRLDPATGRATATVALDPSWFAEGLTMTGSGDQREVAVLTWREGVAAFFDPTTLTERRRATYGGEGWGLCQLDDTNLVMSDGSGVLTARQPDTFAITGRTTVTRSGRPVDRLNELECAHGLVWANVWQTDQIVAIDPASGTVVGELDASALRQRVTDPSAEVLNGIAAVPGTTDEFVVTGKRWPTLFTVRISAA